MKFILNRERLGKLWNGSKELPDEINVGSGIQHLAEFELLGVIATLHGFVTAFDILIGAVEGTEKDTDITLVMTAFQAYLSPKMPLSHYTGEDKRMNNRVVGKFKPLVSLSL